MKRLTAALMLMLLVFSMAAGTPSRAAAAGNGSGWSARMTLPSEKAIAAYNSSSQDRSPYIAAWMDTGRVGRFSQIAVDFKADYLPSGTYCSLANFSLDYSALNTKYARVEAGDVAGYAGFQRGIDPNYYCSILSFWDVFCYDASGRPTTISASLLAPEGEKESRFGGEGTGTHYLRDYPWEAQHWYRFLIQCGQNQASGNTTVEYWVMDLERQAWTQLCVFDLGVPDVSFAGDVAVFLENFQPASAGEVRTLELCNFRVCTLKGEWVSIESGTFAENYDYPGSYRYGSDGKCFWIITSGVPDLAPKQKAERLTVKNSEWGSPF